jgi:hypothetical protein
VRIIDSGKIRVGDLVRVKIVELDRWVLRWEII